jgi:hypothetical protein
VTSGFTYWSTGNFTNTISGPGAVNLMTDPEQDTGPDAPGPDMVYIPPEAVVGTFLADTPVYFAPRADTATNTVIEAGKTMWVYGVDESGAFYKVMLSGKFFWVPVSSMGPTYDEVWNGSPLPAVVAED